MSIFFAQIKSNLFFGIVTIPPPNQQLNGENRIVFNNQYYFIFHGFLTHHSDMRAIGGYKPQQERGSARTIQFDPALELVLAEHFDQQQAHGFCFRPVQASGQSNAIVGHGQRVC